MFVSVTNVWAAVRARLQDELGWIRTSPWLMELELRSCEPSGAVVEACSSPARDQGQAQAGAIRAALAEVVGRDVPVRFVLRRRGRAAAATAAAAAEPRGGDEPGDEVALGSDRVNDSFDLSGFLTGPSNEIPLRFAREVI